MRILVLANASDDDAGFVGDALQARGATLVVHHREDPEPPPLHVGFDAIVSLGSEWSVYWEHVQVEVEREAGVLREAVAADVPVLGLCFGGQILSHALGGSVERAPEPEIGWYAIESDVPHLIPHGPYVQWHSDRFVVPPGARELARSAVGPQAYTLGSAVGLQFHPEASPEVVRRWVSGGVTELTAAGGTPEAFVTESDARLAEARERAAQIVHAFLDGNLRS
jgi:GMP synthase-like glutamine amidotransferase